MVTVCPLVVHLGLQWVNTDYFRSIADALDLKPEIKEAVKKGKQLESLEVRKDFKLGLFAPSLIVIQWLGHHDAVSSCQG